MIDLNDTDINFKVKEGILLSLSKAIYLSNTKLCISVFQLSRKNMLLCQAKFFSGISQQDLLLKCIYLLNQ